MGVAIVGLDSIGDKEMNGCYLAILVRVPYNGSRISDVYIGGTKFQIHNADLERAARLHDECCDTEGG